ncbi:MAG TPA: hypothetical protein VGG29_12675 [Caulobacteraceae bacterium]|jgi:hypothetical protein
MRIIGIAARLAAALAGAVLTYAFAVALLLSQSFGAFAGVFVRSLTSLVADPFLADAGSPVSLTPYIFVAGMTAFYFCVPLVSDLIHRARMGSA